MVIMMTIKYGLQFFFFELTDNDGKNFLAGIVHCHYRFLYLIYYKTVLIWKVFYPNYDFLVPLYLYLVQKYEKNAVANDKWFFAT
jgi:hypothetical protein